MKYRELSIREKVTATTLWQSAVLGLVVGPLYWLVRYHDGSLVSFLWCICGMAAAPLVVDILRPTYVEDR